MQAHRHTESIHWAWLIDPIQRTVESHQLPVGLRRWLSANNLDFFGNDDETAYHIMRSMHHDLPMDAMMEFITEGEGYLIFANDLGNGAFLVLHDDVRDQQREQPYFKLDYAPRIQGPGRKKKHFRRGVLIQESGDLVERNRFNVSWGESVPADSSGYAVELAFGRGGATTVITDILENPKKCSYCGKKETLERFQVCGGCKRERYCSRGCQRSNWKQHKPTCRLVIMGGELKAQRMQPATWKR